jgi:hypothetical protein
MSDETKLEQLYTACKLYCEGLDVLTVLMVKVYIWKLFIPNFEPQILTSWGSRPSKYRQSVIFL